ncbi:hypothetical protein MBCUT_01270 [Methanobrevibacter cuticularis]|uniref:Uncharacterized protein n=2 Tax=Methanobrevibacter cuticularis TaxID=47311 RepID=A0A166FGH9_9EURY|nr:hypothetical protein MBCUT_01270 [Methanobrevibacter cuticularis]
MQELENDYNAGNISEEKYNYLSKEYTDRLANINAASRVRNMQGRRDTESSQIRSSKRSMAEASRQDDRNLVDKYVVKSSKDKKQTTKSSNKGKYAIIAVIFLIIAFVAGISFGLFNDFQPSSPTNAAVTIDDTAFPEVISNVTNNDTTTNVVDNSTTITEPTPNVEPTPTNNTGQDTPSPDENEPETSGNGSI